MTVKARTITAPLHPKRLEALEATTASMSQMPGFRFLSFSDDVERLRELAPGADLKSIDGKPAELTIVFGGGGTLLRAAEWARPLGVPLLKTNLGHVGPLVELETSDLTPLPQAVVDGCYETEQYLVLQVDVTNAFGEILQFLFAVSEASLKKLMREEMLGVLVHVDARPLPRWGYDGALVATSAGFTAYAFSGGRPVVWSEAQATLPMPLSAHVLLNRPAVLPSDPYVSLELGGPVPQGIVQRNDKRSFGVEPEQQAVIRASGHPLRLAWLFGQYLTVRLVRKFELPIGGW